MRLDGLLGQMEDLGDLLVGVGLGDQLEHLLLARRERLVRALCVVGHPVADQRPLDGVGQERLAAVYRADRVEQRGVDLALEHVARSAALERVEHIALVVVHGEGEHLRVGQVRADLARRLEAGHARHGDVHDAQVGLRRQRLLEGVDAVLSLGHHLHVRLALDQQLQAATDDAVVVGYQDPHVAPMVSSMVVPAPGAETMSRCPPTSSARSRMPPRPSPPGRPRMRPLTRLPAAPSKPLPLSRTRSNVRPTNESSTSTSRAAACLAMLERLSCVTRKITSCSSSDSCGSEPEWWKRACTPVFWPKSLTCVASAATRPWSSSAVGRSWRASASSSSIACVTSSCVSCSSERRPHGAEPIVAESRSRIAVSAWLTSSCRSCAIRPRSCSWARSTARPDSRRSSSSRCSIRLKVAVSSCTSRAPRWASGRRMPGRARSTALIARTIRCTGSSR